MKHKTLQQIETGRNRPAFVLFLCTLCFAPLAFGTTETWSLAVVEILIACTGLSLFFPWFPKTSPLYNPPGLLPLLLFVCWMFFQCIPLPAQFVKILSPHTFAIYQPLLGLPGVPAWFPLTVHLKATLLETLRICSFSLFYILTVQILSRSARLKATVNVVVALALFIAFLALLQKFTSPHKIYWFRAIPASAWQGALGPWVYPNQYAGFMIMVCPLVFALLLYFRSGAPDDLSFRQRVVTLFSRPESCLHIFLFFGAIVVLASIFLSHSRGAVLSLTAVLLLYAVLQFRRPSGTSKSFSVLLLFGLAAGAALFSRQPIINKFLYTFTAPEGIIRDGRLMVWRDVINIIGDFPITGAGFATFADIYPRYKGFTNIYFYDHAHNDFLELLTDGGIIGFILAAWFVLTVVTIGIRQIRSRRDPFALQLTTSALCGIAGIMLYSLTDFNLHNGANGLYFFFLCGLLVSAGHTRQLYQTRPTLLSPVQSPRVRLLAFIGILLFSALLLSIMGGTIIADQLYQRATGVAGSMQRPAKKLSAMHDILIKAQHYDPLSGRYPYALANVASQQKKKYRALTFSIQAARRQPTEDTFLKKAGTLLEATEPARAAHLMNAAKVNEKNKQLHYPTP